MSDTQARVDAHHHLWDLRVREQAWLAGPGMAPIRRTFGVADLAAVTGPAVVTATVVVQTVSDATETTELLDVAAGNELVAGVVGWVDLTAPSVGDDLAALTGDRLKGIRHQVHDEPDERWLCRDDVRRGLRAVAGAGLAYDLLTRPPHLPAAIETVAALPELSFVLDHCSKPPVATGEREPWTTGLRELASYPNVTCKLSGLVTEADWGAWTLGDLWPFAEVVLDAFGPDRVMFGSDWPVCLLAASYGEVLDAAEQLTAGLSGPERGAVFGGTATRVYALG